MREEGCELQGAIKEFLKPLIATKVTIGSDLPKIVSVHAYCTGVIFNSISILKCPSLGYELYDHPVDTVFNLWGSYRGIGFIIYKSFGMYDIFQ